MKRELEKLQKEIEDLRIERKRELKEILAMSESFDTEDINLKINSLEKLNEKFIRLEMDLANFIYDFKNLKNILEDSQKRLDKLENDLKKKPIIIE